MIKCATTVYSGREQNTLYKKKGTVFIRTIVSVCVCARVYMHMCF